MHSEGHRATWNDRGDGVFVDHLGDGVAKQHHILVEGFDLTLKLDAVDQIDRHWNVFATKLIQKWVLQELAFVIHDIFPCLNF